MGMRPFRRKPCVQTTAEGLALCFQDTGRDVMGRVSMDACVGHLYFGFGQRGWNPFTEAVRIYLQHSHWDALADYYQRFQPATLAEAYFLRNSPRWSVLNTQSPFKRLKPWRASVIDMSGHDGDGNQNFGPVTPNKFAAENAKYERIIKSIQKHGYNPERYGPIRGYFLVGDAGRYVFRITQGMHRAAILDAMGGEHLSIGFDPCMPRCISIQSLPHWPGVLDGTFSPTLAAYLFRRHFWDRGTAKQKVLGGRS